MQTGFERGVILPWKPSNRGKTEIGSQTTFYQSRNLQSWLSEQYVSIPFLFQIMVEW